jgi:eukaryotic-like serine/threonine-protein kinase
MLDPSLAPDDALLRRFLLGELSGPELDHVAAYLARHPEAATRLNALKVSDTLLDALKHCEPAHDAPAIAALITRLTERPAAPLDDPNGRDPTDANVLAMLGASEQPGDLGRLGRYRVLRVLGRGGAGVVFEAEDDKLKRRVALRAMLPDAAANAASRERFVREAETAAKVEHDNIVPISDVAEANGVSFVAMPLLPGERLAARLKSGEPLPVSDVLIIGRQIAKGLAAAHRAGLIHRDINPGTIWLEHGPGGAFVRARVLGLGMAGVGALIATGYTSPEQAKGEPVDHRADLFALACVLYQMATGRRPFSGDGPPAVLTALATETPPAANQVNPAVPVALSTLIELLLSKDPSTRWPQTAQEVADELFRIATDPLGTSGQRPGLAAPPAVMRPAPRADEVWAGAGEPESDNVPLATAVGPAPAPTRRWVYVALAVLALALAIVGYLYGSR